MRAWLVFWIEKVDLIADLKKETAFYAGGGHEYQRKKYAISLVVANDNTVSLLDIIDEDADPSGVTLQEVEMPTMIGDDGFRSESVEPDADKLISMIELLDNYTELDDECLVCAVLDGDHV